MKFEEQKSPENGFGLKMDIQREIISHVCGFDEGCVQQWVDEQAPIYAEIFEEMEKSNTNLAEEWKENPAKVMDDILGELEARKLKKAA